MMRAMMAAACLAAMLMTGAQGAAAADKKPVALAAFTYKAAGLWYGCAAFKSRADIKALHLASFGNSGMACTTFSAKTEAVVLGHLAADRLKTWSGLKSGICNFYGHLKHKAARDLEVFFLLPSQRSPCWFLVPPG